MCDYFRVPFPQNVCNYGYKFLKFVWNYGYQLKKHAELRVKLWENISKSSCGKPGTIKLNIQLEMNSLDQLRLLLKHIAGF